MSDLNDVTLNWDNEVDTIDENGPRVITDYGTLQYLGAKKVQLFVKDSKVQFPALMIDGKPFERGGMKEGHEAGGKNATIHAIAYFGLAFSDDKPFTAVRIFTTQNGIPVDADKVDGYPVVALDEKQKAAKAEGKTVWLSDWSNLQFPALRQLPPATREAFTAGKKVFFKADNWNTGSKPREDNQGRTNQAGEVKKYYDHYWFNFTIFADEAAMLLARQAAKGTNGTGSQDYSDYPEGWKSAPQQLDAFVKGEFAKGLAKAAIIENAGIMGVTIGGGQVDADSLLRKLLASETPAPMLEAWLVK